MASILVGAKEAVIGLETGKAHSYLVFEDDAGARSITSLTEVRSEVFPPSLRFDVEQIGTPYDRRRRRTTRTAWSGRSTSAGATRVRSGA